MRIQDKQPVKNSRPRGPVHKVGRNGGGDGKDFHDVLRQRQPDWKGALEELLSRLMNLGNVWLPVFPFMTQSL